MNIRCYTGYQKLKSADNDERKAYENVRPKDVSLKHVDVQLIGKIKGGDYSESHKDKEYSEYSKDGGQNGNNDRRNPVPIARRLVFGHCEIPPSILFFQV